MLILKSSPNIERPIFQLNIDPLENLWRFLNQNFVAFTKMTKSFVQCALEAKTQDIENNKVAKVLVVTL